MLFDFLTKIIGSALVAGFREWLKNQTAQRLGAAKQKVKDQEAKEKEDKDVRKIKNDIRTDSDKRNRVRDYFRRTKPPAD